MLQIQNQRFILLVSLSLLTTGPFNLFAQDADGAVDSDDSDARLYVTRRASPRARGSSGGGVTRRLVAAHTDHITDIDMGASGPDFNWTVQERAARRYTTEPGQPAPDVYLHMRGPRLVFKIANFTGDSAELYELYRNFVTGAQTLQNTAQEQARIAQRRQELSAHYRDAQRVPDYHGSSPASLSSPIDISAIASGASGAGDSDEMVPVTAPEFIALERAAAAAADAVVLDSDPAGLISLFESAPVPARATTTTTVAGRGRGLASSGLAARIRALRLEQERAQRLESLRAIGVDAARQAQLRKTGRAEVGESKTAEPWRRASTGTGTGASGGGAVAPAGPKRARLELEQMSVADILATDWLAPSDSDRSTPSGRSR